LSFIAIKVLSNAVIYYCIAQYFNSDEREFSNIDEFCKWVFNKAKHAGYTFIAHYCKGYDFQFIAEWLIAHSVKPNIIHNGQKEYYATGSQT